MSIRDIERKIWNEAKKVFDNPRLRMKDMIEWVSSEDAAKKHLEDGEVTARVPCGFWVTVEKSNDKR